MIMALLLLCPTLALRADNGAVSSSPTAQLLPEGSSQALPAPEEDAPRPRRRRRARLLRVRPANYVRPVGLKVFGSALGAVSPSFSSELGLEIELRRWVPLSFAPQYFSLTTPLQAKVDEYHQGVTYDQDQVKEYREGDPLPLQALGLEVRYRFSPPQARSGFFVGTMVGLGQVAMPTRSLAYSSNGQFNGSSTSTDLDHYLVLGAELGYQRQFFGWLALSGGVRGLWCGGIPDLQLFTDYSPPVPEDFQKVTGFVQIGLFAL
jgi:hypothetical protein